MKIFNQELEKFYNKLINRENFSLARFGDGEMLAIRKISLESGYGEWTTYRPEHKYEFARQQLESAFTYNDPGYYVGIPCPCCQGQENFQNMKTLSNQAESNLTFANIFVNGNYTHYVENFFPEFQKRQLVLIANQKSNVNNLPFPVTFYGVGYNAWVNDALIIDTLKSKYRESENIVFLFACGPLGKILAHQMWENNKNNTYLDIGSTLHPWLGSDINIRGYYQPGTVDSNKICVWGE